MQIKSTDSDIEHQEGESTIVIVQSLLGEQTVGETPGRDDRMCLYVQCSEIETL